MNFYNWDIELFRNRRSSLLKRPGQRGVIDPGMIKLEFYLI